MSIILCNILEKMKLSLILFLFLYGDPAISKNIDADSVITLFRKAWESVEDYECTFESKLKRGEKSTYRINEYKFKKPKWIFIKIIDGKHKGSKVVYNPNTNKIYACKGGLLSFIKITANSSDKKVLSIRGDRIDQSHWGTIFEEGDSTLKLYEQKFVGEEIFEERETWVIEFIANKSETDRNIVKKKFWIDKELHLPIIFEEWDKNNVLVQQAIYMKIKIDSGISLDTFKL